MRVLHVIPSLSELRGGPTFVLRRMALSLAQSGIEIVIACTDDDGPGRRPPDTSWASDSGIQIVVFRRLTALYSVSLGLAKWLATNVSKFDLIHIHSIFNFPSASAGLIACVLDKPYIVRPLGILSEWGFANRRPALKPISFSLLEKPLLLRAAAIHVTSLLERETVETFLKARKRTVVISDFAARVIVIPEPSDLFHNGQTDPTRTDPAVPTVLFMSRIDAKKGLDVLISAFRIVTERFPLARLSIVGPGEPAYIASLKRQVSDLGLDENVEWRGFVGGDEKWKVLSHATVFALPSHAENFAVAVLEALSAGIPVVVSDNVGLAASLKDAHAGLVTSTRPGDVAGALIALLGDPGLRCRLATNGRALVEKEFNQTTVTRKLVGMYASVCA